MSTKSRRAGLALALVCLLSTPSCVTAALWEEPCGRGYSSWSEGEVVGRVLLTPFTLMIDCVLISAYACAHSGHACR
jgi:hypothetical protein